MANSINIRTCRNGQHGHCQGLHTGRKSLTSLNYSETFLQLPPTRTATAGVPRGGKNKKNNNVKSVHESKHCHPGKINCNVNRRKADQKPSQSGSSLLYGKEAPGGRNMYAGHRWRWGRVTPARSHIVLLFPVIMVREG